MDPNLTKQLVTCLAICFLIVIGLAIYSKSKEGRRRW